MKLIIRPILSGKPIIIKIILNAQMVMKKTMSRFFSYGVSKVIL